MSFQAPITNAKTLSHIQSHDYVLPALQREFVWSTDQICLLFDSLMRGDPRPFFPASGESIRRDLTSGIKAWPGANSLVGRDPDP